MRIKEDCLEQTTQFNNGAVDTVYKLAKNRLQMVNYVVQSEP